jgi:surfeit locus 1 family protein
VTTDTAPRRRLGFGFWSFIAFMSALTALFVVLGVWQLDRLAWKEGLIAEVAARLTQPPDHLPAPDHWADADLDQFAFHPVKIVGQYEPEKTVLVFTSLGDDAKGQFSGPGYWVMTPFAAGTGGTVIVNRGFIPQERATDFAKGQGAPAGQQTITGVAVNPEQPGAFTPAPDTIHRVDWVTDPSRLSTLAGVTGPIFPMILDLPAGVRGELPQGGETVIDFPNNHLGYAYTWFGFAILTPCLLAFWIWRQVRPKAA